MDVVNIYKYLMFALQRPRATGRVENMSDVPKGLSCTISLRLDLPTGSIVAGEALGSLR